MTAIAGIAQGDKVWIGGDSSGSDGYVLSPRADAKVFRNGPLLFGFTSSFRMGQLLHYAFTPPDHDPRQEPHRWLVTVFVDAVRKCLKDAGWAKKTDDHEEGGTFLLGYRGRIYKVCDDYQVESPADGPVSRVQLAACGCGEQFVLGALFVQDPNQPPTDRIIQALTAAERYSAHVRRPFVVEVLE